MKPLGPCCSHCLEASIVMGIGTVDADGMVDTVKMVETLDLETAIQVSGPSAKLIAIQLVHAESPNACRRVETTEMMSAFTAKVGLQATLRWIESTRNK